MPTGDKRKREATRLAQETGISYTAALRHLPNPDTPTTGISAQQMPPTEAEVEDVLMGAFDAAYYGDQPYAPDDTITLAAVARRALRDAGYLTYQEGA